MSRILDIDHRAYAEILESSLTPGWEWLFMRRHRIAPYEQVALVVHADHCHNSWLTNGCKCTCSAKEYRDSLTNGTQTDPSKSAK